jgi:monovalent cation:H+ antiporter-2, CPA2 family
MTLVAWLLAAAAVAFGVARLTNLPSIPLLILSGMILSVSGALVDLLHLDDVLVLGLAFLVFSAGTELGIGRFRINRKAWVAVGLVQFAILGAIGLSAGLAFGLNTLTSIYLGLGMAASSTLVVVQILQDRAQFFEPFARLVLGVLLVQDVLLILALALLSHLHEGWTGILFSGFKAAGLVVMALVISRQITPRILAAFALDDEILLLFLLAVLFAFMGLSQFLALPLVVGAFLAGFALTGFPVDGLIRGQLKSLSQFFNAMFFVALGAVVSLPALSELLMALLLSALIVVLTPPLVAVVAERAGLTARSAIEAGVLLSQTSEFSIVLFLVGGQQGHIEQNLVTLMGLVTILTMTLTPFIATNRMTWRLMRIHPSRWQWDQGPTPSDHVLLIGAGGTGGELLTELVRQGRRVVVIDEDPQVVDRLRQSGIDAVRGDGADYRVLEAAGVRTAAVVISTMRRLKDHMAILKRSRGTKVICRVFEEREADRIRARGGVPVLYSRAAAEEFLHWYDSRAQSPEALKEG